MEFRVMTMKILLPFLCALLWASSAPGQDYDIYVIDAGNFSQPPWQILKYDENGEHPEVFITENLAWPHDMVFLENSNTVLVSNFNSGTIDRYHSETGAYIGVFTSDVIAPTRMKIGADHLLYVVQAGGNNRVRRFQLNGAVVDDFTNQGLSRGLGMDWDGSGRLHVSSYDGQLVRQFDTSGLDRGNFAVTNMAGPVNIWFENDGDLFVLDYDGGAVRRFDFTGTYQGDFIQGLSQSEGVDFLPNGHILVGDGGTSSVKEFTPAGTYVRDIVPSGSGGLLQPNAVVVRLYKSEFQINPGLNDAWYNPATVGQGFLVSVFPDIEQMFVAWFTYDTVRPPDDVTAQLGEPGHRWLTAQGPYDGDTANMVIYVTSGGVFDSDQPPAITDQDGDGTLTIEFSDCTVGLVNYVIDSLGISGTIPIQRTTPDNVGLCETLAEP
jgi:hypothetical protein